MTTPPPTSTELRRVLAYMHRDADQLELLLPDLHRRLRRNRGDRDGLRSIAPTGTSRSSDVSNPTHHTAMANIAADDRTVNITPATPDADKVDHLVRSVMLAANLLAEAVRTLGCIDPVLLPAALPACQMCCCTIVDRDGRTDDSGKPLCAACHRRTIRHRPTAEVAG